MQQLLSAATFQFSRDVTTINRTADVIVALDNLVKSSALSAGLSVLGAWHWSPNSLDVDRWIEGKAVFMNATDALKNEYLGLIKKNGLSPTTLVSRRKSTPYTFLEAMQEIRPTGKDRWLSELFRKHGIRDVLYCPMTRWTVGYLSSKRVDIIPEGRLLLAMAASAAIGRLEKLGRYSMTTNNKKLLNEREIGILQLASTGLTADEIASKIQITAKGVHYHISKLSKKLNAKNTTHAVCEALRQGFII